jgi:hypothetical protein
MLRPMWVREWAAQSCHYVLVAEESRGLGQIHVLVQFLNEFC